MQIKMDINYLQIWSAIRFGGFIRYATSVSGEELTDHRRRRRHQFWCPFRGLDFFHFRVPGLAMAMAIGHGQAAELMENGQNQSPGEHLKFKWFRLALSLTLALLESEVRADW